MPSLECRDSSIDIDNVTKTINDHLAFVFQLSCVNDQKDKRLYLRDEQKNGFHIGWFNKDVKGALDHIQTQVQRVFFPHCSDKNDILLFWETLLLCSDDILEAVVTNIRYQYPNNTINLTCQLTPQENEDNEDRCARCTNRPI